MRANKAKATHGSGLSCLLESTPHKIWCFYSSLNEGFDKFLTEAKGRIQSRHAAERWH